MTESKASEAAPVEEPIEPTVFFLQEIQRLIGIPTDPEDQKFLVELADYLDGAFLKDWKPNDYNAAAWLFRDYKTCLEQMKAPAKVFGYRVSIAGRFFQHPTMTLSSASLAALLETVQKLSNGSGKYGMMLPFPYGIGPYGR